MYKSLTRLPSTDTIFHVLQTSTARKLTTQDFTSHWLIHHRAPVYVTHNLFPSRKCVLVKLTLLLPTLLESGGKDDKSFQAMSNLSVKIIYQLPYIPPSANGAKLREIKNALSRSLTRVKLRERNILVV